MVSFSMKVDGVEEVSRWFDTVSDRVKHPQAALKEVSDITRRSIEKNYSSQGRPAWKTRTGNQTWPILWETGLKRETEIQSTLAPWKNDGRGHRLDIFSTFYGPFHQFGTSTGLPVRKSVWLQPHEIVECYSALLSGYFHVKVVGFNLQYQ